MAEVLDPRLAVGKFEQIARKQAAKLRESAGINFHRCASQDDAAPSCSRNAASVNPRERFAAAAAAS